MKKILLVRDYSGMASNYAAGLRAAGHHVTLASIADSFKGNYGCDINLEAKILGNKLVDQYLNYLKLVIGGGQYDVIHLQTQLLAGPYSAVMIPVIAMLRAKAKLMSVSLAGDDYLYWKVGPTAMSYTPHQESQAIDTDGKAPYYLSSGSKLVCGIVERFADMLIPACYDYTVCHAPNPKLTRHVPFAFDVDNTPFVPLADKKGRKLQVFHAVSRKGFKGSRFVIEALRECERRFGDRLDVQIVERVPYAEYKRLLAQCDIFIDQCNSYSYGMAAVEALARGKIVLSGAEDAALAYIEARDCPVINIKPDPVQIGDTIIRILDEVDLTAASHASRAFAERFHSYSSVIPVLESVWGLNG